MIAYCFSLIFSSLAHAEMVNGWQVGPSFLAGFPHPTNLSLDARSRNTDFSFGLTGGYLPPVWVYTGNDLTKVTLDTGNIDARARWHVFKGGFFLGVALGHQWINATADKNISASGQNVPTHIQIDLSSWYVTPHLGWLWTEGGGFFFGVEIGAQKSFHSSNKVAVSVTDSSYAGYLDQVQQTQGYKDLQAKTEKGLNQLGSLLIPYLTLFRIGWMF